MQKNQKLCGFKIENELHAKLRIFAFQKGKTMQQVLNELLAEKFGDKKVNQENKESTQENKESIQENKKDLHEIYEEKKKFLDKFLGKK